MFLRKEKLEKFYRKESKSSAEIAKIFNCSEHKVNYWLEKYNIKKRSISEAMYIKYNPYGDPFIIKKPSNFYEATLFGLGIGLYWGEGNKKNKTSIKLGNTDPFLIKKFIEFLKLLCGIHTEKLRFSLQIFSDLNPLQAKRFWVKKLGVSLHQFTKTTITPPRGIGNYKNKNQSGVLTVHFHNRKLRDIICKYIGDFSQNTPE